MKNHMKMLTLSAALAVGSEVKADEIKLSPFCNYLNYNQINSMNSYPNPAFSSESEVVLSGVKSFDRHQVISSDILYGDGKVYELIALPNNSINPSKFKIGVNLSFGESALFQTKCWVDNDPYFHTFDEALASYGATVYLPDYIGRSDFSYFMSNPHKQYVVEIQLKKENEKTIGDYVALYDFDSNKLADLTGELKVNLYDTPVRSEK